MSSEILQWGVTFCHGSSAPGMIELFRALNETDFRPAMASFTMPTLIIHGGANSFQPIEVTGSRTHRAIPGSRLEVSEGATRGLFYSHKDRLNPDLVAFVRGPGARS